MISPTLDTAEREMVKPIEAIAEAAEDAGMAWMEANDRGGDSLGWADVPFEVYATASLDYLTLHGFLTLDAIVAIQTEKKGAGK